MHQISICLRSAVWIGAIVVLCSTAAPVCSAAEPAVAVPPDTSVRDLSFFLRRLRTVDHLPELEASHTALSSTWDRTGGNLDGWDFKRIEDGRNVLLDMDGPGCIHRIFTGWLGEGKDMLGRQGLAGTHLQIILDHAERPLFDMPVEQFLDDRNGPLPYPLVFHKTYPGTLFPIPFARHCRMQLVNAKAPSWGNFWQIAYTTYPKAKAGEKGIQVKSLTWPLSETEKAELARVRLAWLEAESREPATPAKWSVARSVSIPQGKSEEIVLKGCGVIRQMRFGMWPPTPELLRGVRLQISWDGAKQPSVDVPLGYFFGNADHGFANDIHFNSLLMGVSHADAYCCFPCRLPVARSCGW